MLKLEAAAREAAADNRTVQRYRAKAREMNYNLVYPPAEKPATPE
jgi:hypothetical protein